MLLDLCSIIGFCSYNKKKKKRAKIKMTILLIVCRQTKIVVTILLKK